MADPFIDSFGILSTKAVVLPHESVDEALRRYILSSCTKAIAETRDYRIWLQEASKRWEAVRSTRSLDSDDPGVPWHWASNIGIPLESIAGESIIPRLNGSTIYADPIFRVHVPQEGPQFRDAEERLTKWYQDLFLRKIHLDRVRDTTHLNLMIDGDSIESPEWVEEWQQTSETVLTLQNEQGEYLIDEQGQPKTFPANSNDEGLPKDINGNKLTKKLVQQKGSVRKYHGAKVRVWSLTETIWPHYSITPNIEELDYFAVQAWKSVSWFKTREGDPIQGKLKNVQDLIDRYKNGIPQVYDTEAERQLTAGLNIPKMPGKILTWFWYGKFDVDSDGVDEEVIAIVCPKERMILGWRIANYSKRPFFHYQLFRTPNKFTGRGLPHVLKGMRDCVDFYANQANNHANLYLDPPIMWESDSGFDPDQMEFGTGAQWGPLNPGSIGQSKIKALDVPANQEILSERFLSFYQAMAQRITGSNDAVLGMPQRGTTQGAKTARGINAILGESNYKFGDWIHKFQRISEEEAEYIDEIISSQANDEAIKFMSDFPMTAKELQLPKRFYATGNSQTMNKQFQQQMMMQMFEIFVGDPIFGLMPESQLQIRRKLLDSMDMEISLPTKDQIQQLKTKNMAQALAQLPPEQLVAAFKQVESQTQAQGGQNGNGRQPAQAQRG